MNCRFRSRPLQIVSTQGLHGAVGTLSDEGFIRPALSAPMAGAA
jgi:hypothetical protein